MKTKTNTLILALTCLAGFANAADTSSPSFALFAPGVPHEDKRALQNVLAGGEDLKSVNLVSTLADGISATNSVLVLFLGTNGSSAISTVNASALKLKKVIGIGYNAAQMFENLGLKISAGNSAHGVVGEQIGRAHV